jgi:hypothetical protein
MTTKAIYDVVVQIYPPNEEKGYPGQVCEGKFTHENGVVTLVNNAGAPIRDRYGKAHEQKLAPGEAAHVVAARLTREAWQARGGGKRKFSAPLNYPKLGWM